MNLGVCLFCEEEKELKRSHAIGNTIFRKILKDCEKNAAIRISTMEEKLTLSNDSWATKQLCGECEQYFNQEFEAYSINALRGKVKSVKIVNLSDGVSYSNLDMNKLAKYILSIYWRGAHSLHPAYKSLKIIENLDEHLKLVFKGKTNLIKYINIKISSLYDADGFVEKEGIKSVIISPYVQNYPNKLFSFNFIFEGFLIEIFFGKLGFFQKRAKGFIDVSKSIVVLPKKNMFDIESVVETFAYGKYLDEKGKNI